MRVAVIGGGVAGSTVALKLAKAGAEVELFEKNSSLISGPPFCHLHAGGNLYREISDNQCKELLRQSLEFAKLYPFAIDRRPTVIAIPIYDEDDPNRLIDRLEMLKSEYYSITTQEPTLKQLGEPEDYYQLFNRDEIEELAKLTPLSTPKTPREWLIPLAKDLDLDSIKYPLIVVQEYGINMFRLSAGLNTILDELDNLNLYLNTQVERVYQRDAKFVIEANNQEIVVDYLINATGFKTGIIDDMLGIKADRMVEFKAAYTSHWIDREELYPEVIFHGKRGTPKGMGQFTPYSGGFVQLHAMTLDITLFEDGLAKSSKDSSYPRLKDKFIEMIDRGWKQEDIEIRTKRAIEYLSQFIPKFANATVGGIPLYGAQQIPGDDIDLRVAEASFPIPNYARCEIVKVSSVTDMSRAILRDIGLEDSEETLSIDEERVSDLAMKIADERGYSPEMGRLLVK